MKRQPLAALALCALIAAPVLASGSPRSEPLVWSAVETARPFVAARPTVRPQFGIAEPDLRPAPARPIVTVPESPVIVVPIRQVHTGGLATGSGHASGVASYYDDGPGLYAAVHSYRWGQPRYTVRVCRRDDRSRCVSVTVRDHCQCYQATSDERLIDLSPAAMRSLGGTGLLWVSVVGLR